MDKSTTIAEEEPLPLVARQQKAKEAEAELLGMKAANTIGMLVDQHVKRERQLHEAMLFVCEHVCESQDGEFFKHEAHEWSPSKIRCPTIRLLKEEGEKPRCQG